MVTQKKDRYISIRNLKYKCECSIVINMEGIYNLIDKRMHKGICECGKKYFVSFHFDTIRIYNNLPTLIMNRSYIEW